jgi:hypothetical protein
MNDFLNLPGIHANEARVGIGLFTLNSSLTDDGCDNRTLPLHPQTCNYFKGDIELPGIATTNGNIIRCKWPLGGYLPVKSAKAITGSIFYQNVGVWWAFDQKGRLADVFC